MTWRICISLFLAWAVAFQAVASMEGQCRHASAKADAEMTMPMDMSMSGMDHKHHHAGMSAQDSGDTSPSKSACDCGCDCGGGCAHACHATAIAPFEINLAKHAPRDTPAASYIGVQLASYATPPLRPPSAL